MFNVIIGPKGRPGHFRQQGRPKQHYAAAPDHWTFYLEYLGPAAEYLAENTEAGHKKRCVARTHYECNSNA